MKKNKEQHTKKWTLIRATMWLLAGLGLIGIAVYQYITLGQIMVSVGYIIGSGFCLVPSAKMFLNYTRKEWIDLEAYSRQFDEEVAKRQGEIRIDLNAEKEELKKQLLITEKALELACEELWDTDGFSLCMHCVEGDEINHINCGGKTNEEIISNYFKTKALKKNK